jgi:hypothetical protein
MAGIRQINLEEEKGKPRFPFGGLIYSVTVQNTHDMTQ